MVEAILWFAQVYAETPQDTILDIACGYGRGVFELQKRGYDNVYGVDLSQKKIDFMRERGIPCAIGDMHDLREFTEFDLGFMSHAIEHSLDPRLVIEQMINTCKIGMIICPIDSHKHELGTSPHTSPFTSREDWKKLCDSFENVEFQHYNKQRLSREVWSIYKRKK